MKKGFVTLLAVVALAFAFVGVTAVHEAGTNVVNTVVDPIV
jgi:hypothetical protein